MVQDKEMLEKRKKLEKIQHFFWNIPKSKLTFTRLEGGEFLCTDLQVELTKGAEWKVMPDFFRTAKYMINRIENPQEFEEEDDEIDENPR